MGLESMAIRWLWKLSSRSPNGLVTSEAATFSENLVVYAFINDQIIYQGPEGFSFIDDSVLNLHRANKGYLIGPLVNFEALFNACHWMPSPQLTSKEQRLRRPVRLQLTLECY